MVSKKLNIGCGNDYRVDHDNWDISEECKTDSVVDIANDMWPCEENFYDQIYCSGVLEQMQTNEQLLNVMNEAWRVAKPKCGFTIIVPSAKFSNAFRDPHDVRYFTEPTFNYFCGGTHEYTMFGSIYGYKAWKMESIFTHEDNKIITCVLTKPAI